MRIKNWSWTLVLVSVILGFLAGLQLKAQRNTPIDNLPSRRTDYLVSRLYTLEEENKKLRNEAEELNQKITGITGNKSSRAKHELMSELITRSNILSGLYPVKGQGITIVLKENNKLNLKDNADWFLIHAEDLLNIINEIFSAGAEAISINEQRIITISHIQCTGPTISINGTKIAPPFEIKAIGEPQVLERNLTMRGSYLDTLKDWKVEVRITKEKELEIPAYLGVLQFEYAVPMVKGDN